MERAFALVTVAVAVASGTLMIAGGSAWQRQLGWALWPLLVVVPVTAGALRRRRAQHS